MVMIQAPLFILIKENLMVLFTPCYMTQSEWRPLLSKSSLSLPFFLFCVFLPPSFSAL